MFNTNNSQKFKAIAILSIVASSIHLGLLIASIILNYRGFTITSTIHSYFSKKYSTQTNIGQLLRITLISTAMVGQIIVAATALKGFYRKSEDKSSKQMRIGIYVLASISVLAELTSTGYFSSLFIERHKIYKQAYWDEIFMFATSIIVLILMMACWLVITGSLLFEEESEISPKQDKSQIQDKKSDNSKQLDIQKILFDEQQAMHKNLYETLYDKIDESPMSARNKHSINNEQKVINLAQFSKIYSKNKRNQNQNGVVKFKNEDKRIQIIKSENIQKKLLKVQIQKRKQKFRQINPNKIKKQELSEDSDQSNEQRFKMANLPKSYKQYIKQAKKPNRKVPLSAMPLTKQVLSQLLKLNVLLQNMNEPSINMIKGQPLHQIPFTGQESQPFSLNYGASGQDNQFKKSHFRKKPLFQDMKAKQQLVQFKLLKRKSRARKALFDESAFNESPQQNEQFQADNAPRKVSKKAEPSRQQQLLMKLRKKYNESQIS